MPTFLKLQLLAILQGLTEFLPVSSSGHLVLLKKWLSADALVGSQGGPLLELLLHLGTLLSILVFYRRRIAALATGLVKRDADSWRYSLAIALSCLPAMAFYFLAHKKIDQFFDRPLHVGLLLIATGIILLSQLFLPAAKSSASRPGFLQALGIGCAQAVAILPGISRSGSTYTAGRWLGVSSEAAFDFSFLMSIPVIGGAILLKIKELANLFSSGHAAALLVATIIAAIVGYAALKLLSLLRVSGKLWCFGPYCIVAGALTALLCH